VEQVRLVLSSATPKNLQFSDAVQIGHVHGAGTQLRLWTPGQGIKKNPLKQNKMVRDHKTRWSPHGSETSILSSIESLCDPTATKSAYGVL